MGIRYKHYLESDASKFLKGKPAELVIRDRTEVANQLAHIVMEMIYVGEGRLYQSAAEMMQFSDEGANYKPALKGKFYALFDKANEVLEANSTPIMAFLEHKIITQNTTGT